MASHIRVKRRLYQIFRQSAGYVLAALALVWVFHGVNLHQALKEVPGLNWTFVALAVFINLSSYVSRGLRWLVLLAPLGRLSLLRMTQAVYAGQFANQILPMRLGEVVRTYMVSNWLSSGFVKVVPSVFLERLMDGVWSAIGFGLIAALAPLPSRLLQAGGVLAIFLGLSAMVIVAAGLAGQRAANQGGEHPEEGRFSKITSFLQQAANGILAIGLTRRLYEAFGLSFLFFFLQAVTFWLLIRAYNLQLPFLAGVVVYLVVHVGTIIPNAPANIGLFQFFSILGLMIFHVEKTLAVGFSVVVFFLLGVPLWLVGFFALSRSGVTIDSARKGIEDMGKRR
jgi:hypothetical protein